MNTEELAQKIIKLVGGENNIRSVIHCITRLRFVLKDETKVNTNEIEKLDILGVQKQGDQYQIIIGQTVGKVYREIVKQFPMLQNAEEDSFPVKKKSFFNTLLENLSSILVATLPPIIGGGMIKGISFILTNYQVIDAKSDLASLLTIIGDSMFYFFPFLLAVSAAKKFKTEQYMSLAVAGALMYPTIINGSLDGAKPLSIFGLNIPMINYASSVLPIILGVLLLKYVYNFLQEKMPEMITVILTPVLTLVIVIPVTLIFLAPLGYYCGDYIARAISWLMQVSPLLAGFVIGATRPLLILVGMHHAIRAINMQEIATFGFSTMTPVNFLSTIAQSFATFALFFLFNNEKEKQLSLSGTFSGILGVTEPALYTLLVKYRSAMMGACLGGGLGGMIAMSMNAKAYAVVMPSILTFPVFMGNGLASLLIGFVVSMFSSFCLTLLLGKTIFKTEFTQKIEATLKQQSNKKYSEILLSAPVEGKELSLDEVSDKTFSSKLMGEGIAIYPDNGVIYAPCNGIVEMVFNTKHAIGLKSEEGAEILIHVGIDTVKMNGDGFKVNVEKNQEIEIGQKLLTFDIDKIESQGFDPVVIMVVTNSAQFNHLDIYKQNRVAKNDDVILLTF